MIIFRSTIFCLLIWFKGKACTKETCQFLKAEMPAISLGVPGLVGNYSKKIHGSSCYCCRFSSHVPVSLLATSFRNDEEMWNGLSIYSVSWMGHNMLPYNVLTNFLNLFTGPSSRCSVAELLFQHGDTFRLDMTLIPVFQQFIPIQSIIVLPFARILYLSFFRAV